MTKITELPVATTIGADDVFVIVQSGTTKQVASNKPFTTLSAQSNNIRLSKDDGTDSVGRSQLADNYFLGNADYGPALRIKNPSDSKYFWITPYRYGMGVEYDGTLEFWVVDFSVKGNPRSTVGHPIPPRFWVDDNLDLGGLRMSGVVNAGQTVQYNEIVSERFDHTSHGNMRFILRDSTDQFDFRQGANNADASFLRLNPSGTGAAPNANESTSTLALVSTATAGVNVGPSIRFMGKSGNGVAEYSFAAIQGYKASAVAGEYTGALDFVLVTAVGGVITPMVLTQTGLNSTAIGATSPSTGAFTTISASGQITSTLATGTAPFVIASTTVVGNLNVSQLLGGTWAIPGQIGATTRNSGAFTTVTATNGITHGSATLLTTTTNLTDGAAASLGTLTNAPSAGNPSKWVPINDNGTTRYIPAWT